LTISAQLANTAMQLRKRYMADATRPNDACDKGKVYERLLPTGLVA